MADCFPSKVDDLDRLGTSRRVLSLAHPRQPRSTLFPYTTLFRSLHGRDARKQSQVPILAHLLSVCALVQQDGGDRSEEHTSELQSHSDLVCRLLLEKKKEAWAARGREHLEQEIRALGKKAFATLG